MIDLELQIAASVVVDVSAAASQDSTAFVLGRRGFPDDSTFVVNIEAVSAATDLDPVEFILQVSVDEGSNFYDYASITLSGDTAVAFKRIYSTSIGVADFRDEVSDVDALQVRVHVTWSQDADETDDFTYSAYLAGPNGYPSSNRVHAT